jgi:acetyl-CoA acetyltransferase
MTGVPPHRVIVAGGAMGHFGRRPDEALTEIATPVVREALRTTGLEVRDIQAGFVGNAFAGAICGQESILAQVLLAAAGITGIPVRTIKNACSSGSDAVHLGWSSIAYGQYECVLVLGAEKLTHPDRQRAFAALASATDHPSLDEGRSVFMDVNAARALQYMETYGAQTRHFAAVTVKNRRHGALNARAAERTVLTPEQVLADRVVVAPLTRAMCAGIVDGAACVILTSEAFAARRGLTATSRLVGSTCVSGVPEGDAIGNATRRAARMAYEQTGISPGDVELAEVHDPTAPQELLDIEDLMLCGRGEAIRLVESADTSLGGRIPVNTSGGLTSRGHPVGATGVAQILEIHEQLTGRAGARQLNSPKVGLAQMAGGLLGRDSAVATVHLLAI